MINDIWNQTQTINNLPQIGNTPSVIPRAAEKDNCFGSAPLNKKNTKINKPNLP